MTTLLNLARGICIGAHAGQIRKYTKEPYHIHPFEVADTLLELDDLPSGINKSNLAVVGYLHDTVEDTPITLNDIDAHFGSSIRNCVLEVTKATTSAFGNRRTRHKFEVERLSMASWAGQTVKYADILSNTRDIVQFDPSFATRYLQENRTLLLAMRGGHEGLRERCLQQLGA